MATYQTHGLRVAGADFTCIACRQGKRFIRREIKLNTTGMSLMGLDWLNQAADGAVCELCGYVHSFLGYNHEWVRTAPADGGQSAPPRRRTRRSRGRPRE